MHAKIKNLSIALEAISRINGCRSEYDRIRDLLSEALDEEKEEKARNKKAQATLSAKFAAMRKTHSDE